MINLDQKILVTGVNGQLGFDCLRSLKKQGYSNVLGTDRGDLDITDESAVHSLIEDFRPAIVLHNAAYTAVDKAEEHPEEAYRVNALGPKYIAEACHSVQAKMVFISTDYVFDGKGQKPFETTDSKTPLSIYGNTKSSGEDFVNSALLEKFIIRISWAFGLNGNNFVKTRLRLGQTHENLSVVDDQVGSPTYTLDLSKLICEMIQTEKYGIYHATNEGYCSWSEFAQKIFQMSGKQVIVHPVTTRQYRKMNPSQALRPLNSRLSKNSLDLAGFKRLPTWQDALSRYLNELQTEENNK